MKITKKLATYWRVLAAAVLFIIAITGIYLLRRAGCFDLDTIRACSGGIAAFVVQNYAWAVCLYLLLFITGLAVSIPVSATFSMVGGFLFGWLPTIVLATVSITVGSLLSFALVRTFFGSALQARYKTQLARFNAAVERDGARYLLASRLSLVFPFFLINILAGLTAIPLRTFAWTTVLGVIPSVTIYALAGQQLHAIDSPADLLSPPVLAIYLLLLLFVLAPVMWRYACRLHCRIS